MRAISGGMCVALGIAAVTLALGVSSVSAELSMLKAVKEAGFPAQNCRYCHSVAMPKKESGDLNERGTWLAAEARKKGMKPAAAWLKDYPGGPEQK